jgi:hypothetical protein
LPMPLGNALDLLRDRNNTITLDLPVSGDLESPDFNVNDVLALAVSKGVKAGSLAFLTFMLQPYGAAITLAQFAGEAAMKVRLEPLAFAPGSTELTTELDDYLMKVARILENRPAVNLKVCGIANHADMAATTTTATATTTTTTTTKTAESPANLLSKSDLLELASQRARTVKNRFVTDFMIDPHRLVNCTPSFDDDERGGLPRVELLI